MEGGRGKAAVGILVSQEVMRGWPGRGSGGRKERCRGLDWTELSWAGLGWAGLGWAGLGGGGGAWSFLTWEDNAGSQKGEAAGWGRDAEFHLRPVGVRGASGTSRASVWWAVALMLRPET